MTYPAELTVLSTTGTLDIGSFERAWNIMQETGLLFVNAEPNGTEPQFFPVAATNPTEVKWKPTRKVGKQSKRGNTMISNKPVEF